MGLKEKLLQSIPFVGKTHEAEYFFALNIDSQKITAAVWGIVGNRLEIINTSEVQFRGGDLRHVDFKELADAANQSLDEALADFNPEPVKVLFGVPDSWLIDDNLKEDYLKMLRRLVKELDVVPMAYVSTTHAIAHALGNQQGVPVSAILVGAAHPMVVSVVKSGKVMASKAVKRSQDIAEDVQKVLLGVSNVEVLPSKIYLYAQGEVAEELGKIQEKLLSFPWMQQLPFLHLPKVEILPQDCEITSICLAGAVELNPNVVFQRSREETGEKRVSQVKKAYLADNGFVAGDIEKTDVREEMEQEVGDYPQIDEEMEERAIMPRTRRERSEEGLTDQAVAAERSLTAPVGGAAGLLALFRWLPAGRSGVGKWVFVLPVIVVGFAAAYLFLVKATVTVYIDPKVLEKDATVIADPALKEVDEANKKIPGKIYETEVTGGEKGAATGKKQIGDPAKGTVIIYNKTDGPKTFAGGTVLVGPSNLTFTLNSSVTVASQSALDDGKSYGKGTGNVTAAMIGPEGNLNSGVKLSIKGESSSSFDAKVDQPLSGGTSKDVTVVTDDDRKRLLAQVSAELRKKAKEDLQGKLSGDVKILEEALAENITKTVYTKQVGDQATEFGLTLTADYKGTAYSDNDLKTMVSKLVQTNVPEGYELKLSDAETQAAVSKLEKDGKLIFAAKFKAKLMPKVDKDKIKKEIRGKSVAGAAEILKGLENVIGSDIVIKPSLPGFLQRLPFLAGNISLDLTTK